MACGVPVIALKGSGGPDEIITDNFNEWLVELKNLNKKVLEVLKDRKNLKKVSYLLYLN